MATAQKTFPEQAQNRQPGIQSEMVPKPLCKGEWYKGSGKLVGKTAFITGGDSGIGRAVAIFFAREGADIAISYLDEHGDAEEAKKDVEAEGQRCVLIPGDISRSGMAAAAIERAVAEYGKLDIVVNNAAFQEDHKDLKDLDDANIEKTFRTNIFSYIYVAREALKHLPEGSGIIINTTSVTAYRGSAHLVDYASTKGAIVAFTRSLASMLVDKGIRVNAVAPGPIWTPLIPASFSPEEVSKFGADTPMKRAGHPEEVAPAYVFLASRDSSYITGQVIHPNGGEPTNS